MKPIDMPGVSTRCRARGSTTHGPSRTCGTPARCRAPRTRARDRPRRACPPGCRSRRRPRRRARRSRGRRGTGTSRSSASAGARIGRLPNRCRSLPQMPPTVTATRAHSPLGSSGSSTSTSSAPKSGSFRLYSTARMRRTLDPLELRRADPDGASSAGSGSSNARRSPVVGWSNTSCAACRNGRSSADRLARAAVGGVADDRVADRARGAPGSDACGPVSSRQSSSAHTGSSYATRTSYSVRAALPDSRTAMRVRRGGRPPDRRVDHAARRAQRAPHERDVPALDGARRDLLARGSRTRAADRAATSSPLVSRSRRCTMPGRSSSPTVAISGIAREQAVHERAVGVTGAGVHDETGRLGDARSRRRRRSGRRRRRSRRPPAARRPRAPRASRSRCPRRGGGSSPPAGRRPRSRRAPAAPARRRGSSR